MEEAEIVVSRRRELRFGKSGEEGAIGLFRGRQVSGPVEVTGFFQTGWALPPLVLLGLEPAWRAQPLEEDEGEKDPDEWQGRGKASGRLPSSPGRGGLGRVEEAMEARNHSGNDSSGGPFGRIQRFEGGRIMKILVVEDDRELAGLLVEVLEGECYAVDLAADGETADELTAVNSYDLVVLDWSIPSPDGLELLRRWRGAGQVMPVLMLTGRTGVDARVDGLDTGADDYLTKPFSFRELLARVRSLLRRREKVLKTLAAGDVVLDRPGRTVTVGGEPVTRSSKEFAVLEYFLTRVGEVITREDLVEHAWDDSYDGLSNVIDVTVYRLRKKIDSGRSGRLLQTVKGAGYRLLGERS